MILNHKIDFRREWDMGKAKWDLNMREFSPCAAKLIQISRTSLIHSTWAQPEGCMDSTAFFGLHPKHPGYNQNFLRSELALSRKCYNTVSTVSLFLPTLTICSNTLDLILNLFFFSEVKRLLRFQHCCDFALPSIPGLWQHLLYFANLYVSGWEAGN